MLTRGSHSFLFLRPPRLVARALLAGLLTLLVRAPDLRDQTAETERVTLLDSRAGTHANSFR